MGDRGSAFQRDATTVRTVKAVALLIFFYPVRWGVRLLPRGAALAAGSAVGYVHALFVRDVMARRIREGIDAAMTPEPGRAEGPNAHRPGGALQVAKPWSEHRIDRVVRRNLVTRYRHLIESFLYARLDEDGIGRLVPTVEGKHYLDEALSGGKGAILLASHFGSFGMLIAGLVHRGYRLHQVLTLAPPPPYRTWRWVDRAVMRAKLRCWRHERLRLTWWTPGAYLRPLYRTLRRGEILVVYGDATRGVEFVNAEFMGRSLALSAGPFRIAAAAGVPLIPAFILRDKGPTHRIILEPPIVVRTDDASSVQDAAKRYAALLASYVRRHPEQWYAWARLGRATRGGRELEWAPGAAHPSEFHGSPEVGVSGR